MESREEFLARRKHERERQMVDDIHEIRTILERLHPEVTTKKEMEDRRTTQNARDNYWFDATPPDFPMRAIHALQRNADSIEHVRTMTDDEILRWRNVGHGTLALIRTIAPHKEVTNAN